MSRDIEEILADQPKVDFTPTFGDSFVDSFRTKGFTMLPRITTDEEVIWLREVYDWLFGDKSRVHFDLVRPYDSEGEDRLPQIIAPEQRLPALKDTAFWRNGRVLASALMDVELELLQSWGHMIRKPPKIGEELPWHQDEAYWDPAKIYKALGSWMPLDDATPENGCMSFIPGSHRSEVMTHRHVNDDPQVHGLYTEPDPADIARAELVPVPAGGVVLHHSRTLHRSGPNTTDRVRRAYSNEWQLAPVEAEATPHRPWIDEHRQAWSQREANRQKA